MPHGDVETFHDSTNSSWTNQIEGQGPTGEFFETKPPAVEAGRDLARSLRVEHIVKNQDGTTAERSSYGHDPRDIPG